MKKWVSDYIEWISPILLILQHLKRKTRAQIEKKISVQANSVLRNYRLYLVIVNSKLFNAA